jgi:hypothetical protein
LRLLPLVFQFRLYSGCNSTAISGRRVLLRNRRTGRRQPRGCNSQARWKGRGCLFSYRGGSDVTHKRRCYSLDEGSSVVLEKLGPATATAPEGNPPRK